MSPDPPCRYVVNNIAKRTRWCAIYQAALNILFGGCCSLLVRRPQGYRIVNWQVIECGWRWYGNIFIMFVCWPCSYSYASFSTRAIASTLHCVSATALHEITTDIGCHYDAQNGQTDEDHDFLLQRSIHGTQVGCRCVIHEILYFQWCSSWQIHFRCAGNTMGWESRDTH